MDRFLSPSSAKPKSLTKGSGSKWPSISPNKSPNKTPSKSPNRSPNSTPFRSPNRSPNGSPPGSLSRGESRLTTMLHNVIDSVSSFKVFSSKTLYEEEDEDAMILRIYGPENGKEVINIHNLLDNAANELEHAPRRSHMQPVLKQFKPKQPPKKEIAREDMAVYVMMVILVAAALALRLVFYHTIQYLVGLVFCVGALLLSGAIAVMRGQNKDIGCLPLQTLGCVLIEIFETGSLVYNLHKKGKFVNPETIADFFLLFMIDLFMLLAVVIMYYWFKRNDCPPIIDEAPRTNSPASSKPSAYSAFKPLPKPLPKSLPKLQRDSMTALSSLRDLVKQVKPTVTLTEIKRRNSGSLEELRTSQSRGAVRDAVRGAVRKTSAKLLKKTPKDAQAKNN